MSKQLTKQKTSRKKRHVETFDEKKERYETPFDDYDWLMDITKRLGLPVAELDIMASKDNTKCMYFLDVKYDSTTNAFLINGKRIPKSIFLNSPHKLYNKMVPQCHNQWKKYGFTIISLIPSRNERTKYWHKYIEANRFDCVDDGFVFYIPLEKRFIFEIDGEQAHSQEGDVQHDPNGYKLVFWIGKKYLKNFKKNLRKFYHWYYVELPKQKEKERLKKLAEKGLKIRR